jgi:hypothetical protein
MVDHVHIRGENITARDELNVPRHRSLPGCGLGQLAVHMIDLGLVTGSIFQ